MEEERRLSVSHQEEESKTSRTMKIRETTSVFNNDKERTRSKKRKKQKMRPAADLSENCLYSNVPAGLALSSPLGVSHRFKDLPARGSIASCYTSPLVSRIVNACDPTKWARDDDATIETGRGEFRGAEFYKIYSKRDSTKEREECWKSRDEGNRRRQ